MIKILRNNHPILVSLFAGLLLAALPLLGLADAQYEANQKTKDQKIAEKADAAYANKQFSKAMDGYTRLAEKGDFFSQYRLSFMNLQGEGVAVNYPEAFAWAVLAAESQDEKLQTYFNEVKALVPESERDEAQQMAEKYLQRWGRMALAIEGRRQADQQLRNCTGSRLGTRCDEVYAMQMPKFWTISPGEGDGVDGGSSAPSGSISAAQTGAGGAVRDAEHYAELREARDQLDLYISNNAGTVEIGELEVIEPEQETKPADNSE
ncbi:MAG TPA: hypothetical protein VFG52_03510 [Xanthomonadales bacterium]|nr:hypothetical protein [Xanthomonadales bacterium]